MDSQRTSRLLLLSGVVLAVAVLVGLGVLPQPWSDDRAEVRIVGDDGTTKVTIDAEVADTARERYVGLSEHDSLEPGEGMLFVHAVERERTYVMRDMDFDIEMLFVGADGEVTTDSPRPRARTRRGRRGAPVHGTGEVGARGSRGDGRGGGHRRG